MNGKWPFMPKTHVGIVDVRNVAQAHVNALKFDEAQGKRYLLSGESMWAT